MLGVKLLRIKIVVLFTFEEVASRSIKDSFWFWYRNPNKVNLNVSHLFFKATLSVKIKREIPSLTSRNDKWREKWDRSKEENAENESN